MNNQILTTMPEHIIAITSAITSAIALGGLSILFFLIRSYITNIKTDMIKYFDAKINEITIDTQVAKKDREEIKDAYLRKDYHNLICGMHSADCQRTFNEIIAKLKEEVSKSITEAKEETAEKAAAIAIQSFKTDFDSFKNDVVNILKRE